MKTSFLARLLVGGTLTSIGAFPNIVKIATEKTGTSGRKIRSVDSKGQQLSGSLWDNLQINGQGLRLEKEYCFYYDGGSERNQQTVNIVGLPKKGINRNQCQSVKKVQERDLKDKSYVEVSVEIPIDSINGENNGFLVFGTGDAKRGGQVLGCIDTKWWKKDGYKNTQGIIVWDSFLKNGGKADCAHRMYVGYIFSKELGTKGQWNNEKETIGKKWKKAKNGNGSQLEECNKDKKNSNACLDEVKKMWENTWTQDWNEVKNEWEKYGTVESKIITWTLKQK